MNLRKFLSMSLLAALLVGAIAFAFPGSSVAAQAPTPQPKDPAAKASQVGARLEKAYQAAQKMLDQQAQRFERADAYISKAEALIAKAKANGKDTTVLDEALAQIKTKEADAKKLHEDAANILKNHAGFDANGKVTDRAAAKETLQSASEPAKEAHQFFGDAWKALKDAVKSWRQANPAKTTH
jgi:hypothetical protein